MSSEARDERHLHRLILFSDAVFAIAITLLAIEIHPPEAWRGGVAAFFGLMGHKLTAYAVSFAVIGVYWIAHRRSFGRLLRADGVLDVLNLLMLGLLGLLPLGTVLLWEKPSASSSLLYIGLVAAIGVAHAVGWAYAAFIGKLVDPAIRLPARLYVLFSSGVLPGLICALLLSSLAGGAAWGFVVAALLLVGSNAIQRRLTKTA